MLLLKRLLPTLVLSVRVVMPLPLSAEVLVSECQDREVAVTKLLSGAGYRSYNTLLRCRDQAVPTIIEVLSGDESAEVRGKAAEALGSIDIAGSEVAPALMEALSGDESAEVRGRAAEALGFIDVAGSEVAPALMEALSGDESA
ncbi:MAG: HEAT repeat domain-containing protein, partial [Cyanobacteria bacterium J06626_18]